MLYYLNIISMIMMMLYITYFLCANVLRFLKYRKLSNKLIPKNDSFDYFVMWMLIVISVVCLIMDYFIGTQVNKANISLFYTGMVSILFACWFFLEGAEKLYNAIRSLHDKIPERD